MKKNFLSRISHNLYALAILFLLPCAVSGQGLPAEMPAQAVSQDWARRFDGQARGVTQANIAAIDAEGNVYISGTIASSGSKEIITVKYAPTGQELWSASLSSASYYQDVKAIAVDNLGSVYVTGTETHPGGQQFIITVSYNAATGAENWVRQYAGEEGETTNEAQAIGTDGAGGVFVTGLSTSSNTGADFVTIRYDAATGAESWVNRYNAQDEEWSWDMVKAIALDGAGGVYVAGTAHGNFSGADFIVLRYDATTGAQSWVRRYNGEAGTSGEEPWDEVQAIATDGNGGVYVTGLTLDYSTYNSDFLTIRYEASSGEMSWVSQYNGLADGWDAAKAIATDNAGGVYITGTSLNSVTGFDYATIRYEAATGAETWVNHYDGGGYEWAYEEGRSIATDGQGSVYVTGRAEGPSSGPDFGTIRYDASTGAEMWSKRYNGGAEDGTWDEGSVILPDKTGGLYVIGTGNGPLGSEGGTNFTIVRYQAATGEENWVSRYEGLMVSTDDYPISLVVDADGNTYVTGTSYAPNWYTSEIVIVKYSPSGEELWVSQFKEGINNTASAIALDQSGGVFITGVSESNSGREIVAIGYDAGTGEQSWAMRYGAGDKIWGWDDSKAITTDDVGGVFVTGYSYGNTGPTYTTIRYEATSGKESWVNLYAGYEEWGMNEAKAIVADGAGGVFVTGTISGSNGSGSATIRYEAATGEMSWTSVKEGGEGSAIAPDKAGGVYVTGSSYINGNFGYLTLRYDAATGTETWSAHFNGREDEWSWNLAKAITTDNAGGVYVTGTTDLGSGSAYATLRYEASDGAESWVSLFNGEGEWSWNDASAIATDEAGGVYVTGISTGSNSVFATVKYRADDGAQDWVMKTEGPFDGAVDLALDAMSNVYVTGHSLGMGSGVDFLTVRYSQNQCQEPSVLNITGDRSVAAGTSKSVYAVSGSGATSFLWSISGDQAVSFSGQGTSAISVDWPSNPGVYKLSLTYSNGCTFQTATTYVFVSHPAAGFVTGGGWIQSPKSSQYELMQQAGKANFSLNAKYKKDGSKVEGKLQLQAPSFRFVASTIEDQTLVIAGTKAWFTGHGTLSRLDGSGKESKDPRQFGFLLSVTDGNSKKGSGTDNFRLMIWALNSDKSPGQLMYDNQFTCSPASLDQHLEACNPIEKGSITIHKGKENARTAQPEELHPQENFSVYPVPFADQLNLKHGNIKKDAPVRVALVGVDGRTLDVSEQIVVQADGYLQLNFQQVRLNNGFYILRIQTAEEPPITQRVLAQQ